MTGKSTANGSGASINNGPKALYPQNGWQIKPETHWDFTEGRRPA